MKTAVHFTFQIACLAVLAFAFTPAAHAANGTWSATPTDANWVPTGTNWSNGATLFPGAISGTTNTDVATFNSASTQTSITINSPTLNIKSITFDTASAAAYTIGTAGGNALLLTSGGAITMNSTVASTETINAPLVLQGAAYALTNNATSSSARLNIGGGITGGAAGATVLTLSGSNTGNNTISGVIANGSATTLAVNKSSGTWVLTGNNTYTGTTTATGGFLTLGNGGTSGSLSANSTIVLNGSARFQINRSDSVTQGVDFGLITASAGYFNQIGTGTTTLVGNNTITNVTTVSAGRLNLTGTGNIGTGAATGLTLTGGTLDNTSGGALTFANAFGIGASSTFLGTNDLTFTGAVTVGGAYSLTVSGGNLTLSGVISAYGFTKLGAGTLILSGNNTYNYSTNAAIVNAGVLSIRSNNALGSTASGTLVASGAALQIQDGITVGAEALNLSGTGIGGTGALRNISGTNIYGGLVTLGGATRINSDSGSLTLGNAGTIVGGGFGLTVGGAGNTTINSIIGTTTSTLAKDGTGTLTLTGANTYTGVTTVSVGTLLINGNSSLATGAISVASSAILGGAGTVGAGITSAGMLSPGDGTTAIGTFHATALTLNTGANFQFDLGASNASDRIVLTGAFTRGTGTSFSVNFNNTGVANSTYTLATFASLAGGFTAGDVSNFTYTGLASGVTGGTFGLTGTDLTFTTVPEPATWALLAFS
ncbi:MAG: beta strand repeat-containing protein, partial [Terrimicrobiaceae bacterium]